jgi:tripartite-type tricarboxylate transporter receptor subunit TctC
MNSSTTLRAACAALLALLALPGAAADKAEAYPSRPIRFLVGFAAGGANDLVARMVATRLGPRLGQQVIVDNRAGGGGILAHELLVNAAPDGYTMILASVTGLAMAPALRGKVPYDPIRDFVPVAQVVDAATLFSANPSSVSKTLGDLVTRARKEPGALIVGNPGIGSVGHLAFERFASAAGIKVVNVPYKSGGLAATAAISGQVEHLAGIISSGAPHVKAGKLRGLAVTSARRAQILPDVPTVAEQGFPGFEASGWLGIAFPAKTPAPVVQRMYRETQAVMAQQDTQAFLAKSGLDYVLKNPEEFRAYIKAELSRWTKLIKDAGIKAD